MRQIAFNQSVFCLRTAPSMRPIMSSLLDVPHDKQDRHCLSPRTTGQNMTSWTSSFLKTKRVQPADTYSSIVHLIFKKFMFHSLNSISFTQSQRGCHTPFYHCLTSQTTRRHQNVTTTTTTTNTTDQDQ